MRISHMFFFHAIYKRCILVLFLSNFLISCDSTEDIPIKQIDMHDTISDIELEQLQSQQQNQRQQTNIYYFGFDLRSSPQEDAAQYQSFLKYLESATGYQFKLYFTPKNSSTVYEMGQNNIHFAAMGAAGYLEAHAQYGAISLARGINNQGKAEYQSAIVVKPSSTIKKINDIKGRSLAFGNYDSTQGHLIPRILLAENGISLDQLSKYHYTGSHQNCAEAVVSGHYDVCTMQDQLAKLLASQGQLRIIQYSRFYPSSGIVANKSVPSEVIVKVKQALLDFDPVTKHKQGLYHWNLTEMPRGFIDSKETDYVDLLKWLLKLGLLEATQEQAR